MSYWTKRRRINECVAQQIADLSSSSGPNAGANIDSTLLQIPPAEVQIQPTSVAFSDNKSFSAFSVNSTEFVNDDVASHMGACSDEDSNDDCDWYCDSDDEQSSDAPDDFLFELSQWYCRNHVTVSCMSELLVILRRRYPDLPKDPRTLMSCIKTASDVNIDEQIQMISNGIYYHFGLVVKLLHKLLVKKIYK